MGQTIEVLTRTELGENLIIAADRSWSGQDGEAFSSAPTDPETFPAQLAEKLFDADLGIDHVYVMSNTVSLRRPGGWTPDSVESASGVISSFFRFYGETKEQPSSEVSSEEPSPQ